ncbi:hypothetical protein [Hyphomicrobium sp. MC8b]|uniref:hypothetical protein n=1 Tax=Hyphomicrobium sp. MC8b TaxID=300273 RepID=UPI00391CC4CA
MKFGSRFDDQTFSSSLALSAIWVALIAALSVGGSFAFACAAPLAAIAALAATRMDARTGLALVVTAWLTNQIVGYAFLSYPHTFESYAWGAAIATIAAFAAARLATGMTRAWPVLLTVSFLLAFAAYELALYVAGIPLGSSDDAFSVATVARVFEVNALSFAGLLILSVIASRFARPLVSAQQAPRTA